MIFEYTAISSIWLSFSICASDKRNDFPIVGSAFKSGSTTLENLSVKFFKPAKPESTINKEAAPRITPITAM